MNPKPLNETFPFTVEPAALNAIRRLMAKDGRSGLLLRVGVKGGGCSGLEYVLRLESETGPNDLTAEIDGVPFLCDRKSAKFLQGSIVQFTGNLVGSPFKIENPNAARSCGCGTSFTPKSA